MATNAVHPALGTKPVKWAQYLILTAIAAVAILTLWFQSKPVLFFPLSTVEFVQLMTPLIMLALFIERATEVFLTAARGQGAATIALDIKSLAGLQKDCDPSLANQLASKQQEEVIYKAKTQRIAFLMTFLLGIIVSALGVRAIGMFVDPEAFRGLHAAHQKLFTTFDVILTGALLGGGADGLHKLVSVFTSWMDKAKASKESPSGNV